MSFPWLMVKVQRHKSISITYQDESGQVKEWNHIDQATSELLQHEIDHLDGVLAVDR
jgi:peptide deformylase